MFYFIIGHSVKNVFSQYSCSKSSGVMPSFWSSASFKNSQYSFAGGFFKEPVIINTIGIQQADDGLNGGCLPLFGVESSTDNITWLFQWLVHDDTCTKNLECGLPLENVISTRQSNVYPQMGILVKNMSKCVESCTSECGIYAYPNNGSTCSQVCFI